MADELALKWRDSCVIKLFQFAQIVLEDLNKTGYSEVSSKSIDASVNLVSGNLITPEALIVMFLNQHKHWGKALDKDIRFIIEDIPKIFTRVDTTPLIEPIRIYETREALYKERVSQETKNREEAKKNGTKRKDIEVPQVPITEKDYTSYWNMITSIIKGAYAYNLRHLQGKEKFDLSLYESRLTTKK